MKTFFSTKRATLAIQWNDHSLDYVLGNFGESGVKVEVAGTVPLMSGDVPDDVAAAFSAGIEELAAGQPNVVVAAARQHVEVFQWDLPPATDQELAELVAHQVLTESDLGESVRADFLPLDVGRQQGAPRRVFGVVANEVSVARMRDRCSQAGLAVRRIDYRPTATANLFRHTVGAESEHALLISLRDQDAHLSICHRGNLRETRSFVLSTDSVEQLWIQLAVEIHRSISVVTQDAGQDSQVNCCYLYGDPHTQAELAAQISAEVGVEVTVLDPFASVGLPADSRPDDAGRFAPLVGILYGEWKSTPGIDLLHPRRPPEPVSLRRRVALVAAAAIIFFSLAGYYVYDQRARSADELKQLQASLDGWHSKRDKLQQRHALVSAIRDWQSSNVIWLDEMRILSERFPEADRARVRKMSMASTPDGGSVDLQLEVRDSTTISKMEQRVRDAYHQVNSKRISENAEASDFPWRFQTQISIQRPAGELTEDVAPAATSPIEGEREREQNDETPPAQANLGVHE